MQNRYKEVLECIKEKFELYQSFCFEQLSRELLEKKFNINGVQSYWDKNLELDLYYQDENCVLSERLNLKIKKFVKIF